MASDAIMGEPAQVRACPVSLPMRAVVISAVQRCAGCYRLLELPGHVGAYGSKLGGIFQD